MADGADDTTNLDVEFGGYSTQGIKSSNEDAFAAYKPNSLNVRKIKGAVACVADGVSCSENAQHASQTSVTQFIDDYYSTPDTWPVKTAAARVLSSMNSWLFHYGQRTSLPHNGLVSTFSSVVFKSTTAHIFHVGDSRIYRLRDGRLEQLTRDHSHKSLGSKVFLTRALGMDSRLEVDYQQEDLRLGDLYVLTTDGVHEYLNYLDFQNEIASSKENLEVLAKKLVMKALENGSEDNLSCLFTKINSLPKEEVDEVHRQLTALKIPPVMDVGMSIDGFEVIDVIYSGTRSHIYLVQNRVNKKRYILKAPSENFSEDTQYLEGFIREQWVGRRIDSPNVMKIYSRPEGSPFLYHLCEHIQGKTLRQWMFDNPHPSLDTVRDLVKRIVSALRVFQRMEIIHRDIKPENIMLDESGQVKIIDFGTVLVAGLEEIKAPYQDEVPVGSVNYSAPEYMLESGDYRVADMFSLGVMVYEMLTGELPFKESLVQKQATHYHNWRYQSSRKFRNDIPEWMDQSLKKSVEPDPRNRYPAYSEFLQDLSTPNTSLIEKNKKAPLIERNPVRFWQLLALVLLVSNIFLIVKM